MWLKEKINYNKKWLSKVEFQNAEGRTAVAIPTQNKPDLGVTFADDMQTFSFCKPCFILSNNFKNSLENNTQKIKNTFIL